MNRNVGLERWEPWLSGYTQQAWEMLISLWAGHITPKAFNEFVKVGESTGALTEMLANVSEFYDEEIESRLTRLVSAIEPLILVFMGGVIAILLYAFYLPLFQLSNVAQ